MLQNSGGQRREGCDRKELLVTRRISTSTLFAGAVVTLLIAVAGCGSSNMNESTAQRSNAPEATAPPAPPTVAVGSSGLGNILVDSRGRTVYMFGADSGTTSACNGACAVAWPPVPATGNPTAGPGVNAALVGTTNRSDGTKQVTDNGHPLYTFVGDQKPGDTNGQGRVAFGGRWSALSSAGVPIAPPPTTATAPPATAPPPTAPPATAPPPTAPPATMAPAPKPADPGVPQHGGGDNDSDNNGGPDDGDGGV
jgi:predicted lipoprotein with Yx(FWY)xxD motif